MSGNTNIIITFFMTLSVFQEGFGKVKGIFINYGISIIISAILIYLLQIIYPKGTVAAYE
jgi:hypothetical protein